MGFTERIAVVVDSNVRGAVRGLAGVGNQAATLEKQTGSARAAMLLLDRSGLAAATTFGGKLKTGIAETGTVMGGMQKSGVGLGQVLGGAVAGGAAIGATALAAFAFEGVQAFQEATGEVRTLQRTMGGTMEGASRLRFAAKALGVDLDSVGRGAGLMAKSIGNGTSKLGEYGVEIARDSKGNVDMAATIANVAQAFQSTDDPAQRAAIGAAAFGRGWQQMAPILGKSREELKALYDEAARSGQIFSEDDTERGRRLARASHELELAVQGLEIAVGEGLVPVLSDAAEGLTDMTQGANQLLGVFDTDLGGAVGTVVDIFAPLPHLFKATGDAFEGHFADATKEYVRTIPGVGAAVGGLTDWLDTSGDSSDKAAAKAEKHAAAERQRKVATDQAKQALLEETEALTGLVGGELAYESSLRSLAEAQSSYMQAQAEADAAGGRDVEKNKAASDALFALRQQLDQTAAAAKAKAEQDAGPGASATEKAKLGNDAYRASLAAAASSEIPAVKQQALELLGLLGQYQQTYTAHLVMDSSQAIRSLDDINAHAQGVARSIGSAIGSALDAVGPRK